MRAFFFGLAGLCCLPGLGVAEGAVRWDQGTLSARLVEAGYSRDIKSGRWDAEVELRFNNLSPVRRFNQPVQVQFLDAQGKIVGSWKTFLSLPPGQAQHRRVRAPGRLGCSGELTACPGLSLRLSLLPGKALDPPAMIPARSLREEVSPPEGVALYAARVFDGDTFQLLDGQKVRLLGIDAPEMKGPGEKGGPQPFAREAGDYLRKRLMDGPLTLAYDGERKDVYGRWLALVQAEDGGMVNLELLQKGLAWVYQRSEFKRKAEFDAAEKEARLAKRGLWAEK